MRPSGPGGLLTARDEVAGQSGDVMPVLEGDRQLASVLSLGMSLTAMQAALLTPTYPILRSTTLESTMLPLGTVLDCSISSEVGKVHIDIAGQTEGTCHSAHAFSHYQFPRSSKRTIPTTRL